MCDTLCESGIGDDRLIRMNCLVEYNAIALPACYHASQPVNEFGPQYDNSLRYNDLLFYSIVNAH